LAAWSNWPVIVWDTAGKVLKWPALEDSYFGAAVAPGKSLMAFGDESGNVLLFDMALGKSRALTMTKPADFHGEGAFRVLSFSLDGRYLAASGIRDSQNRAVRYDHVVVWELATGRQLAHFQIVIGDDLR